MKSRPRIVLAAALRLLGPLVRLLLREGVAYPAFVAALKPVFLQAARAELAERRMAASDSAVTLLSGVHRRDVRRLGRTAQAPEPVPHLSLAGEIAGRWTSDPAWLGDDGHPRVLPRTGSGSFDELVGGISSDVRPRAMLDEMLRLGVAAESEAGVALVAAGFAPRDGFEEMAALFASNLHDHLAAAGANLHGSANFLEQALYVDQISPESARLIEQAAAQAWRQAVRDLMPLARERFDGDASLPPAQRARRARFGAYFFSEPEDSP